MWLKAACGDGASLVDCLVCGAALLLRFCFLIAEELLAQLGFVDQSVRFCGTCPAECTWVTSDAISGGARDSFTVGTYSIA